MKIKLFFVTILSVGCFFTKTFANDTLQYTNQLLFACYDDNSDYDKISDLIIKGADVNAVDATGMTPLLFAATRKTDERIINALIFAGAEVNKTNKEGYNALVFAVLNNKNPKIISSLIKNGANVNLPFANGFSPLHFALSKNVGREVVLELLENKADVKQKNADGHDAMVLAAMYAKDGGIIRDLIDYGADFNQKLPLDVNLLMLAVMKDQDISVIEALIEAKININAEDINGETALMYATRYTNDTKIAETLIANSADVNVISKRGETAYLIAEKMKKQNFLDLYLKEKASPTIDPIYNRALSPNSRILHLAEKEDAKIEQFRELVSLGADINAVDTLSRNVLMLVSANNKNASIIDELLKLGADEKIINVNDENILIYVAKYGKNKNAISYLVNAGISPNAQVGDKSAFMTAIEYTDDAEIIREFVSLGASLKQATIMGDTPLILAARQSKNVDVIDILIKGSDIEASNAKSETALITAIKRNNNFSIPFVKSLLKGGADVNAKVRFGLTPIMISASYNSDPSMIDLLMSYQANINEKDYNGDDALKLAVRNNQNEDVIRAIIRSGANVNSLNNQEETALMLALEKNMDIGVLKALIDAGADINVMNKSKETILLMATRANTNADVLKALVSGNPNLDVKDMDGFTPLLKAVSKNTNPEITTILLDAGAYINEIYEKDGSSALILAIKSNPNTKIAEILIERGANVSIIDKSNQTALDYMGKDEKYKNSNALKLLLARLVDIKEYAMNIDALNKVFMLMVRDKNTTLTQIRMMIDNGADINSTSGSTLNTLKAAVPVLGHRLVKSLVGKSKIELGSDAVADEKMPIFERMLRDRMEPKVNFLRATPLMLVATYNNNTAIFDYFVKTGVNINQGDGYRNTVLHYAVTAKRPIEIIKSLINLGAGVNHKNAGGYTALMYAAIIGDGDTLKALLDAGAEVKIRNKENKTAYDYAILYENFKNSSLLKRLNPNDEETKKEEDTIKIETKGEESAKIY